MASKDWNLGKPLSVIAHVAAAAALVAFAGNVHAAQAGAAKAARDDTAIEEVVVTAMKRGDQALQEVPSSIAVMPAERLEKIGAVEFSDFSRMVAGLNFADSGPGNKRYIIRGISTAGEPQAALYYDNIPTTGLGGAASDFGGVQPDLNLYDVQQIEVLRGPQGTLYGSNSQAGVIRIVTKQPNLERFEGAGTVETSITKDGGGNGAIKGVVNLPFSPGQFAVRLVGYYDDNSGFIDNPLRHETDINDSKDYGGRLSAKLQIGAATSLLAQIFYHKLETDGRPVEREHDETIIDHFYPADGERRISLYSKEPHEDTSKVYALTLDHDFGWSDLVVAASKYDRDVKDVQDYTVSFNFFRSLQALDAFYPGPIPEGGVYVAPQSSTLWSGEARLSTKLPGRLNGVGGVYYSNREINYLNDIVGTNFATGGPDASLGRVSSRSLDDKTKDLSVFGEVTWQATDAFSLTGGARWFRTTRDLNAVTIYPFFVGGPSVTEAPEHGRNSGTIYKALLSYKLSPDAMIYAEYAEGYRAGGTNPSTVAFVPPQYDPDTTKNYEIGAKSTWLDKRVTFNVAAYQIYLYDLQVEQRFGPGGAFSGIGNLSGKSASSKGLEADLSWRPNGNFEAVVAATYNKAVLEQTVPTLGDAALKGAALLNTPKFNGSVSADYSWPVGRFRASVGGNLQYVGKVDVVRYDEFNRRADAYTLVNVRTGLGWDRYDATLYVSNLFDEDAQVNVFSSVNDPYLYLTSRPRTIGVRLNAHW